MSLENVFEDGCGNRKNINEKQFLLIKNCLIYNIIYINRLNIFLLELNLDYIWTMSFSSQKIICYFIDQINN